MGIDVLTMGNHVLDNKEILGGRRGGVPAMTLEYAIKTNKIIHKKRRLKPSQIIKLYE